MTEQASAQPARLEGVFSDDVAAAAVGFAGLVLHVVAGKAYPPGRPLSLVLDADGNPLALAGRCIGSKRRPEGSYDVRVRLTNLTRPARLRLEATFGEPAG